MPNPNNPVMRMQEPETTIANARERGFTAFTFYPTADAATQAAFDRARETGRKTLTFTETVVCGKFEYVLHVVGETPRPKPQSPIIAYAEHCRNINKPVAHKRDLYKNTKLNAFAVFMGEWAAKIRNAVNR